MEDRGIVEATQAQIQTELARQAEERGKTALKFGEDITAGFKVNLKGLEDSISQFGESRALQAALKRVGGFGEAAIGALSPDIGPIESATQDIADAYDSALTQVENRIDQFGDNAERKILRITERIAGGVRTFIDERLARQLEFEGTRR